MAAEVTILVSPSGATRTRRALALYRAALASGPPGTCLWIAPDALTVRSVRDALLDGSLTACFNPQIWTFHRLADALLGDSPSPPRPVSDALRRILIGTIVADLHRAGRLDYFSSVADTAGFLDVVVELIRELKRDRAMPEAFRAAAAARGPSTKDLELAEIYDRYQAALAKLNLYDIEGQLWLARDLLQSELAVGRRPTAVPHLRLVVVDAFTDLTRIQHDLVELLAEFAERMIVTLPGEEAPDRPDLFAKPAATLAALARSFAAASPQGPAGRAGQRARGTPSAQPPTQTASPRLLIDHLTPEPRPAFPALDHLEAQLFRGPCDQTRGSDAHGLRLIAAPTKLGEVRMVAGRVKELLLAGVPAEEIGVVCRTLDEYAPLFSEVFTDYGIPLAPTWAPPLARNPAVAHVLRLARLPVDRWPFRELLAVLSSDYFEPDWPGEPAGPSGASLLARSLRRLGVSDDQDAYLNALEGLAGRPTDALDPTDPDDRHRRERIDEARRALPLARKLFALLDGLSGRAPLRRHIDCLSRWLDSTGLAGALASPSAPTTARDQAALTSLFDALGEWLSVEELPPGSPRELSGSDFVKLLTDLVGSLSVATAAYGPGRVRLFSALEARSLSVDHLFLAGLAERDFPLARPDDPLYSEADRHDLNRHGLNLSHQARFAQEEMLLFFSVLTSAGRELTFSYPAVDEKGQALLPSPFLEEVLRLFPDRALDTVRRELLDPVPTPAESYGPAAWRTRALLEARQESFEPLARWLGDPARRPVGENILAAVEMAESRSARHPFGPFEGILLSPAVRDSLTGRFGPDHVFSPTELEEYTACPFKFFASRVLDLEPLEEPELRADPPARGRAMHRALAEFHRRKKDEPDPPPDAASLHDFFASFSDLIARALDGDGPALGSVRLALREIDGRVLSDWAAQYAEQWHEYRAKRAKSGYDPRPAEFEIEFGLRAGAASKAGALSDPATTASFPALQLGTGAGAVRIGGRIDRIDLAASEGPPLFSVIDYKTGSAVRFTSTGVAELRDLQLSLYALAVERVLLAGQNPRLLDLAYWAISDTGYKSVKRGFQSDADDPDPASAWEAHRPKVERRVLQLARDIRGGAFPVAPQDEDCTARCPFKTVCRITELRPLNKPWQPPPLK